MTAANASDVLNWKDRAVSTFSFASLRFVLFLFIVVSCSGPPPELRAHGYLSGRVLIAPGVGLAHATLAIEQIELYDDGATPRGTFRNHILDVQTDENGFYGPVSVRDYAGLFLLRTMGGEYRDPISGARIRFDASQELRALHFMDFFHTRTDANVTPVHSFVEARFRYLATLNGMEPLEARRTAYADIGAHFGNLDWDPISPAEPGQPAVSPTDDVRAMAVLGGLAILTDDLRIASGSTPQVVNLMTLTHAIVKDLEADPLLDGNDANDAAPGTGLQVGTCEPTPPGCAVPPTGCQLGACRPRCDTYANTYRGALAAAIRKYLGPKEFPTQWNRTGLGSEDARTMLEQITAGATPLFGDACKETVDRVEPSLSWEVGPVDGAAVKGTFAVRVRALDDAELLPSVSIVGYQDEDSAPNTATITVDTRAALAGSDGPLTLQVVARDAAGNERRGSRTFDVDNTAPLAALDATAFYVDGSNVHWTATATPVLQGTISDAHTRSVEVLIGDTLAATATVEGMTWSATVPAGRVTSSGVDLSIRAEDEAGNVTTTLPVLLRLDATPPAILVESSPVYDEGLSREFYDLDNPGANLWLQRHVVQGAPIDLSQSMEGTCLTVRKYAHLLHEQLPLGVAGALNPLQVSSVVSDDGVGIRPGSVQVRLMIKSGSAMVEALPWTAVSGTPIGSQTTRYPVGLFRDGALAIPSLATTEGEYLFELRAVDHLGRLTRQARCWNHRILAPKLRATPGEESGKRAEGFSRAMYSTSLNPVGNQVGDFSSKFLNANAAGAAVWAWRFKNYVAHPVYVTVTIAQPVNAQVYRKFEVRQTVTDADNVLDVCGSEPCPIATGSLLYASPEPVPQLHQGVRFRARAFIVANASTGETGSELLPCAGCTNDDAAQSYTFHIPARATPQGSALVEYVILTYLRPTLPAGGGLDALMAPSMVVAGNPYSLDTTPGPYSEFTLNGVTLTGKLIPPPGAPTYGCLEQSFDGDLGWVCNVRGRYQRYRALTYVRYAPSLEVRTTYSTSALSGIPPQVFATGTLPSAIASEFVTTDVHALP